MSRGSIQLIPFGKYKGQPIEVLRDDPGYRDWLMAQDWMRNKYPSLVQIIVNNLGEPSETPEHNLLQVRFLDNEFCIRFLRAIGASWVDDPRSTMVKKIDLLERHLASGYGMYQDDDKQSLSHWREALSRWDRSPPLPPYPVSIRRGFEIRGWDVFIEANLVMEGDSLGSGSYVIELKPALGDDYPAVLRQMKSNFGQDNGWRGVLVINTFTATGATVDQVREIFISAGFKLLNLSDI